MRKMQFTILARSPEPLLSEMIPSRGVYRNSKKLLGPKGSFLYLPGSLYMTWKNVFGIRSRTRRRSFKRSPSSPFDLRRRFSFKPQMEYLESRLAPAEALTLTVNGVTTAVATTFGQSVALAGTATGVTTANNGDTIQIKNAAAVVASTTLNVPGLTSTTGTFSVSNSTIAAGSYSLVAHDNSSPPPVVADSTPADSLTISAANTSVTVTPASPSVVSGQNITFTAKISNTSATNEKPTGSVIFEDNGVQFGSTITLPAEAAGNSVSVTSAATSFTVAGGVNTITAVYTNSDGNFNSSMGSATPFTAGQASSTTSDVTSSVASQPYGQTVTFSATISAVAPGTGVPTGTVNFLESTTTLGSGTVSGTGLATFSIASLTAGTHIITASYGGDTEFKTSNDTGSASKLQQEVTQAGTALSSVTSSLTSPYTFGQANTYTATVSVTSGLGGGTLTGTVTFKDGGVNLGSGTVGAGGVATFSTASLIVGTHSITASYGGTANYLSSNSAAPALVQTVSQGTDSVAVTVPSGTVYFGQLMTYTATVNDTGGTGAPTGTVTFTILNGATTLNSGSVTLGSINSTQAQAKYVTTGNMGGITQTVSAKYNGDTNFPTAGPATGTNAITAANTKTTVSVSSNNLAFGGSWYPLATVSVVPGQGREYREALVWVPPAPAL